MVHRLEERGLGLDRRDRGVLLGVMFVLLLMLLLEDTSIKSVDTSIADELLFPSLLLLFTDPPNRFRLISSLP